MFGATLNAANSTVRSQRRIDSPSVRLPDAEPGEAWQHLVAEVRHLVEIVDERHRDAAQAGAADIGELFGDAVRGADERIAADRLGRVILLLLRIDFGGDGLAGDVLQRHHLLDRAPVGIVDLGVAVIVIAGDFSQTTVSRGTLTCTNCPIFTLSEYPNLHPFGPVIVSV